MRDSGFHFQRFQGAASRFNKSDKTLDFMGCNSFQPHLQQASIKSTILSQLLSQFSTKRSQSAGRASMLNRPSCRFFWRK
jgi:hypothetical protein